MKSNKPNTTEEWLEVIHPLLVSIDKKLDKDRKLSLADIGLINTRDLCLLLSISAKTVALWRKKGEIRFTKKFGRYYYLLSDVKQMMYEGFGKE